MIAGDVFVFPKTGNADAIKAQQALATVMTSPAAQVAFNNRKGSIPVRTDVDAKAMDLCAQAGIAALQDKSRHIANPDMLMAPDQIGAVQDAVTKFWNTSQSVDDAVKALQAAIKG
jgi:glucose/mannose transport system substrate-binding protein